MNIKDELINLVRAYLPSEHDGCDDSCEHKRYEEADREGLATAIIELLYEVGLIK